MGETEAVAFAVAWALATFILGMGAGMRRAAKEIQKSLDKGEPCWRCKGSGLEFKECRIAAHKIVSKKIRDGSAYEDE